MMSFVGRFLLCNLSLVLAGCVEASQGGQLRQPIRDASRVQVRPPVRPRMDASIVVVLPVGEDYRSDILRAYRRMVGEESRVAWLAAVNRCLVRSVGGRPDYLPVVKEAARLMGDRYSPAFITGLIVHESWCRSNLVTGDGGTGYAQITPSRATGQVDQRWLRAAQTVLGHLPQWRTVPLDNIVLGLVELREAEIELGSRELGVAAYNAGIAGVRQAQRATGWQEGQPYLSLKAVASHLAYRPHRWDARGYAAKVFASGILVERVRRGLTLTVRRGIPLASTPGAIPNS